MLAERSVIESTVPLRWVWSALTDADQISQWSGFDRCMGDGPPRLDENTERTCTMTVAGQSIQATLTVLEATDRQCLRLRTEAAIATVYETVRLEPGAHHTTIIAYELDVFSPLLQNALKGWIAQHVSVVDNGLRQFLDAHGHTSLDDRHTTQRQLTDDQAAGHIQSQRLRRG